MAIVVVAGITAVIFPFVLASAFLARVTFPMPATFAAKILLPLPFSGLRFNIGIVFVLVLPLAVVVAASV